MKEKLQLRNEMKAKKPNFLKQDAHKVKKLKKNWRAPRGMHSKLRKRYRSYRKHPSPGYSSPKLVRGLTKEGHKVIIINNLAELENIKIPIIIAARVGDKKKIDIIKKALSQKIKILNIKDPEAYVKKVEETLKKKKEEAKQKKEKKAKKKKETEKKEEKPKKEEPQTEKEKEKEGKEEKRKVLEKKT